MSDDEKFLNPFSISDAAASLYQHSQDDAINFFRLSLGSSIGANSLKVSNNLSIAYLQKGWFKEALKLLNRQRELGYVSILPYILSLLANGQIKQAQLFYDEYNVSLSEDERRAVDTLFCFDSVEPSSLDSVRELLYNNGLWLYLPCIKFLIQKWELEVFYVRGDRYQVLFDQSHY